MKPIRYGIIGGGWRSEFFIRVAQALPEQFEISSVLMRDPAKAEAFAKRMHVKTSNDMDQMLADKGIVFVVLSVPMAAHPELLGALAEHGMPVLCETPAARDVSDMEKVYALTKRGLRVQIAEQLHLRPMHAARINITRSGLLGNVYEAQVSVAHGYHGLSLIRRLLGITFEEVTITARRFTASIMKGPGRNGPPAQEGRESRAILINNLHTHMTPDNSGIRLS